MSLAVVVLNAAYVALLASTFTRTITRLRTMLVLAAVAFVIYGLVEDIPSMVGWNIAIGSMHAWRIVRDYRQQKLVSLTPLEQSLRDDFFPDMSDFDFHVLWCMGESVQFSDELIVAEQTHPHSVSLVLDGTVVIERRGEVARGLRRGGLVGEMSYVSGQPAQVNVLARGDVTMRRWDDRQLGALEQLHPASWRGFRELMSRDLVAKAQA